MTRNARIAHDHASHHPSRLASITSTRTGHPERPDRLRAIESVLEQEKFQSLAREQAPMAELETIALCHPMDYIEEIRERRAEGRPGAARCRHLDVARHASRRRCAPPAARRARSTR